MKRKVKALWAKRPYRKVEPEKSLEEAIQINPFNPTIYTMLVEIYSAQGDQEKAKQAKVVLDKLMTAR